MKRFYLLLILLPIAFPGRVSAQSEITDSLMRQREELVSQPVIRRAFVHLEEESALKIIDNMPAFGIGNDNYFLTGIATNHRVTGETADVKVQLSIRQRLTQSILPFKTFLYLSLTQKICWDLYRESAPFRDYNINPGISLAKVIIRNNELKGVVSLALEHESNGEDSLKNRSWNMVSFSSSYFFNPRFKIDTKVWVPFWIAKENADIVSRRGVGYMAIHYRSADERLWLTAQVTPVHKFGNFNTLLEAAYKVGPRSNQYWFLQYYNGYGESMIDYDRYTSMIRVGFCVKPNFMSVF